MRASAASQPPHAILLVRMSAIGDIVFASPLIASCRKAYPQARIYWLLQPEYRTLLEHHPALDGVIECRFKTWRKLFRQGKWISLYRQLKTFRHTLRALNIDLALDLQGLLKSGLVTWLSGAQRRIGLGSREGSQWLMTAYLPRSGDVNRISSEYLFLAQQLGLPVIDNFAMSVPLTDGDRNFATQTITRLGLHTGFVACCPFTTRDEKFWLKTRWLELMTRLYHEHGLIPVLLGGPAEQSSAQEYADALAVPCYNLAGQTSLSQAAAMISQAKLVIAVDTGLGHMGIACRVPSVLLFGATCPYTETGFERALVIHHEMSCHSCEDLPKRKHKTGCMHSIQVDEVIEAAEQVMRP